MGQSLSHPRLYVPCIGLMVTRMANRMAKARWVDPTVMQIAVPETAAAKKEDLKEAMTEGAMAADDRVVQMVEEMAVGGASARARRAAVRVAGTEELKVEQAMEMAQSNAESGEECCIRRT